LPVFDRIRILTITLLGVILCLYTLFAVNYVIPPRPESALAIFVMIGLVLCFLVYPVSKRAVNVKWLRCVDLVLAIGAIVCFGYMFVQSEPWLSRFWPSGAPFTQPTSLGNRRGVETSTDMWIGLTGLLLVLEATRRSIGWIVPALALLFIGHTYYCYLSVPKNETQVITITGEPTDGTFTISDGESQSPPLKFDAGPGDMEEALDQLSIVGNNVSVSGQAGGPWELSFKNKLAKKNVDELALDISGLTGGAPQAAVQETVAASAGMKRLPDWLLPHQGQSPKQIASSTFLQPTGVLGPAANVMFKYVFLFVVFGAFLEMSGATKFIIEFSERVFGRSTGGPALVSVAGSGLMGSLSGSAVANAVTTGAFTIPMMRNAGFKPHVAGGITAAAASGGALVPPVMGAGAYMMLEFVKRPEGEPPVNFLEIARAALIPAILYYLSLLLIVYFYSKRVGASAIDEKVKKQSLSKFEGWVFFGALSVLVGLLFLNFSPFKAVTGSLVLILVMSAFRPQLNLSRNARIFAVAFFFAMLLVHQSGVLTRIDWPSWLSPVFSRVSWFSPQEGTLVMGRVIESLLNSSIFAMFGLLVFGLVHSQWRPEVVKAFTKSSKSGISLVSASACVGIVIGVVQTTPLANEFGEAIKGVVESSLLLALIGIMICSLVLGMGVPSVVCYLLMATLMGSLLGEMGVDPLAAHMFIFYFGMMSMVTPPVALAAYASASIADAKIMPTAFAAFRFSLVGFTLPFMFVYRPALLLMNDKGRSLLAVSDASELGAALLALAIALSAALLGVFALSVAVTGYLKTTLIFPNRVLCVVAAAMLLLPHIEIAGKDLGIVVNGAGAALFIAVAVINFRRGNRIDDGNSVLPAIVE
jgi:TRAP transporter 4TM/12TM fusion protein